MSDRATRATLQSRRETDDGQRPHARHLDPAVAARHPLVAFALLRTGDLFDPGDQTAGADIQLAAAAVDRTVDLRQAGADGARIRADIVRQLSGNGQLVARMAAAKPIRVDVVASRREMVARGYPRSVAQHAAGLFWDHPDWAQARIAFRRDRLAAPEERTLVIHEYAHAIHYLGLTAEERRAVAGALARTFGHPADQDEVFAIYSEREFLDGATFSAMEKAVPGVYGVCRQQWSEEHAFAAFIKKLYRPRARVRAGDQGRRAATRWQKFLGT